MNSAQITRGAIMALSGLGLMISFQNCSKVAATDIPTMATANVNTSGDSSPSQPVASGNDGSGSSSSSSSAPSGSGSCNGGDTMTGGGKPISGGPISSVPGGGPIVTIGSTSPEGAPESDTPACDAANGHKQYLLDQLVENGMAEDLSVLQQKFQMQFIHDNKAQICEAMGIKVQGEGLCTAFHGILLEEQDPVTKVIRDLFSVQPASMSSSACKAGSFEQKVYDDVLNALNHADSVDFQASGDLVVKSGNVVVTFVPKH